MKIKGQWNVGLWPSSSHHICSFYTNVWQSNKLCCTQFAIHTCYSVVFLVVFICFVKCYRALYFWATIVNASYSTRVYSSCDFCSRFKRWCYDCEGTIVVCEVKSEQPAQTITLNRCDIHFHSVYVKFSSWVSLSLCSRSYWKRCFLCPPKNIGIKNRNMLWSHKFPHTVRNIIDCCILLYSVQCVSSGCMSFWLLKLIL